MLLCDERHSRHDPILCNAKDPALNSKEMLACSLPGSC
jgi:hypothetical protein